MAEVGIQRSGSLEPARAVEGAKLRVALRSITVAWIFGALWLYTTTGAALTRFAQLLHMPEFGFGLMAALPYASVLIQLPVSWFLERAGRHKLLFIGGGVVHRGIWILIALIPWIVPEATWWPWLLALTFLTGLCANIPAPIWFAWMGDLVPRRIRGRYFSRRTQIGQGVGLVATLVMGTLMDRFTPAGAAVLLKTISIALVIGGIAGVIDFLFFANVPPPARHKTDPHANLWSMIQQPLADRDFRYYIGFTATMTFATGYIGQYVWVYIFDVLRMSNVQANAMLVVMPLIIMMFIYPMWGRIIDRFGRKPVQVICGILVINGASAWVLVGTPGLRVAGYVLVVISVLAWPGIELANFNTLLGISESLSGRKNTSGYIAIVNVINAIAGVCSGLFGSLVAKWMGEWKDVWFSVPMTYHTVLFLVSGVLRALSLLWLIGLEDKRAVGTRDTLRYITATLYSNLQQVMVVPVRIVARMGRLTYKMNPMKAPPKSDDKLPGG